MRIESRIADLHAAIDAEWQRKQAEEMKELADKHGPRFAPDEGWQRLKS